MVTLEEKIGQMILLGFRGLEVGEDDPIVRDIRELNLGGVILFDSDVGLGSPGRNVRSPAQVRALNASLQSRARVPLLVAVDQEGGEVSRLKEMYGFPASLSAQALGSADETEVTRRYAEESAAALAEAGFTVNFAPCVDLHLEPANPIIGKMKRSYGAAPDTVTRHAREVIRAHQQRGVACAAKHFPGHGSSLADTHLGFVEVTETWSELELEPYKRLIDEGICWSVMTAHVYHAKLDTEFPATLSQRILGEILRDRFHFDGVVFSDDMEMRAISSRYGLETAIFRAVEAGVDVLVFANNVIYQPDVGRRVVSILTGMVRDGRISEERIDESFRRIMELKEKLDPEFSRTRLG